MENKRYSFGYEDTDKKIEIELYELVFEIKNLDDSRVKEFENMDRSNKNVIENSIESILGKDCIEKINDKRRKDGYNELTLDIELNILGCIFDAYANSVVDNVTGKVTDAAKNVTGKIENFTLDNFNREQRRNYNKGHNSYRNYKHRRY